METLVLGGTAWLGRTVTTYAQERGHEVTCLARGESGPVAEGVTLVTADRRSAGTYDAVSGSDWDLVVDVSWPPDMVRSALAALSERAAHWEIVSSCSVYADHSQPDADESADLLPALEADTAGLAQYGEARWPASSDLAEWLVRCGESGTVGTFNVSGERLPFADVVASCLAITGSEVSSVRPVSSSWLLAQGVDRVQATSNKTPAATTAPTTPPTNT